jgi:molecular chaperone GrpE
MAESKGNNEIEELQKALAEQAAKAESNLMGWQRAQADFINYKRYVEQEKADSAKFANTVLLNAILPILDDFERALASVPAKDAEKKWVEGMRLIDRKFRDTLEKQGVTCIKAEGEEFDPRCMEALGTCEGQKDLVIQELEKGYKLFDKVIRPAKVMVGSGESSVEKEDDHV